MSKRWNSPLPSALVLTGVVAVLFGFVAQAQSDPVCAALVITGHPSYPPIAWATQGKIVGAAPNLVSGIAAKLGVKDVVSKDAGDLVNREIVHNGNVAALERWGQTLLQIGEEHRRIHGALDHEGRDQRTFPQAGHEGNCLPMFL